MSKQIISALTLLALSAPACADYTFYKTGADLEKFLDASQRFDNGTAQTGDGLDDGFGMGYIIGVLDLENASGKLCTPPNVSVRQVVAMVRKYLDANPEQWNRDAATLVDAALRPAFSCTKK